MSFRRKNEAQNKILESCTVYTKLQIYFFYGKIIIHRNNTRKLFNYSYRITQETMHLQITKLSKSYGFARE